MDAKKFMLSFYNNATEDYYIDRIRNPTNALHLHTHDYYQIYYVLRGSVNHHLGGNEALLFHGDVFIIPPNIPHYISTEDPETEFYSLSFMPDYFSKYVHHSMLMDFLHYLKVVPTKSIRLKLSLESGDSVFAETLLDRIMMEFTKRSIGSEEMIRECTALLITLFSANYFKANAGEPSMAYKLNKQYILHCIDYIKEHCCENITLDEMSRNAAMSKSSFCRLFSTTCGMTFKQFLNTKRIEKAVELINAGEHSIGSISTLCGYEDFSTFYRNFKKVTGVSPQSMKTNAGNSDL